MRSTLDWSIEIAKAMVLARALGDEDQLFDTFRSLIRQIQVDTAEAAVAACEDVGRSVEEDTGTDQYVTGLCAEAIRALV